MTAELAQRGSTRPSVLLVGQNASVRAGIRLALESTIDCYEARTPAFAISIKQLELYQDPLKPALRQVTATFELSHAVEPGELESKIRLTTVGDSGVFGADDPSPHFTINYDLFHRTAYLRSSLSRIP